MTRKAQPGRASVHRPPDDAIFAICPILGEDGEVKSNLLSRRDLDFLLYEWLRIDELTKRERFADHSRETFSDVLDLCEELATRYFAPHNKKSDANEPTFDGHEGHASSPRSRRHWTRSPRPT